MASAKKCKAGHKGCTCGMMCCALDPALAPVIKADAGSASNWAGLVGYGPACTCGMKPDAGHSSVLGVTVKRGVCYRHEQR